MCSPVTTKRRHGRFWTSKSTDITRAARSGSAPLLVGGWNATIDRRCIVTRINRRGSRYAMHG